MSACVTVAPSARPSTTIELATVLTPTDAPPTREAPSATPRFDPEATDRLGVVVWGTLGTAGCLVLTPSEDSPQQPLGGLRSFEVHLADGYQFVRDDPSQPSWGSSFKILDPGGHVVAESGASVQIFADIPTSWGSTCMVGQPLDALFIRQRG